MSIQINRAVSKLLMLFLVCTFVQTPAIAQVVLNELVASNQNGYTDENGEHPDWIELYNSGDETVNLLDYGISDDAEDPFQWRFPDVNLEAGDYLLVIASGNNSTEGELHTNFSLSADGETVVLTDASGTVVDEITYPALNPDEAYGRAPSALEDWMILQTPTSAAENSSEGFEERLTIPELTEAGGFYSGSITVNFTSPTQSNVYYTTDGNIPTTDSDLFNPPITFTETTTLRLRAIEAGQLSSDIITHTYFIDADHELPVISIVTGPDNLWSDESGIYVEGTNGISTHCSNGPKNWNQDWEIPVHLEFFEEVKTRGFQSNAGVKIFGGCSRNLLQKSLSVFFRGEYGNPELNYKLFENKDIDTFQSLVLRNSGQDSRITHFRDGLMQTLIKDTEIDYQSYRPAVLYLNGEYWGIQNIREKINEHFIASNHNIETDELDLLENYMIVKHGTATAYRAFFSYVRSANMENQLEYEEVAQQVDLENYIDYMAAQIYFVNKDWPGNNIRYWRQRNSSGKWRWILYDTDYGFNLTGVRPPDFNMLEFATDPDETEWPNPAWSTLLFRKFLENESFRNQFVVRYGDLLNTVFEEDKVLFTIDSLAANLEPEMAAHKEKWGGPYWYSRLDTLKSFARKRNKHLEDHIEDFFNIGERKTVTLDVSDKRAGYVRINRIIPEDYPWQGGYFSGVPVEVTAFSYPGYVFKDWTGTINSSDKHIQIFAEDEPELMANFEASSGRPEDIVINEIMYNAPDDENPEDWVELYNASTSAINLSGWVLKDEDDNHEFIFPSSSVIEAKSYAVIAQNQALFNSFYDIEALLLGDMNFGLGGGGDQVRLYTESGELVDSVEYDDSSPWPLEADGGGHSLELLDITLNNELGENWKKSMILGGSPGRENQKYFISTTALKQNYPNPFSHSTTIEFEISEQTHVKLIIYDVLGREVAVLADEKVSEGVYYKTWNTASVASGVYIYQLITDEQPITKKMLLIK